MTSQISILIAFTAGLLSFFSPCVLPLIPSYLLYIAGMSAKDYTERKNRFQLIMNALLFVFGFSLVFVLLGGAVGLAGGFLFQYRSMVRIAGGLLIILLGLNILGWLKIPWLNIERRWSFKKPAGYLSSFLVGVTFAAAWTPCVGPILASILTLAVAAESWKEGVQLLAAYSLGLGVLFFASALLLDFLLLYLNKFGKYIELINKISGALLIILGCLFVAGYF